LALEVRDDDEESFCDVIASEMLMPRELIEPAFNQAINGSASPSNATVRLARAFNVSTEAMSRRLVEDLGALRGVMLGVRWLDSRQEGEMARQDPSWRLAWWAATPDVMGSLYLPPVSHRPKVSVPFMEEAYLGAASAMSEVPFGTVRLGNLGKIMAQLSRGRQQAATWWIHSNKPEAVQLPLDNARSDPDHLMRRASELVVFWPAN
jgi:hypothetical protein